MKIFNIIIFGLLLIHVRASSTSLEKELEEIATHIDFHKIFDISREYFENDPTVKILLNYICSDSFIEAVQITANDPKIADIIEWMKLKSFDIELHLSNFMKSVRQITKNRAGPTKHTNSFSLDSFGSEIIELIDLDQIVNTIEKLQNDGNDFAHLNLILLINRETIEQAFENKQIIHVQHILEILGIDVDIVKQYIFRVLKWT